MTLGERDPTTTAIPSIGVMALIEFLRPLGLDGVVVEMRGLEGIGELDFPTGDVSPTEGILSLLSSSDVFAFSVDDVSI